MRKIINILGGFQALENLSSCSLKHLVSNIVAALIESELLQFELSFRMCTFDGSKA